MTSKFGGAADEDGGAGVHDLSNLEIQDFDKLQQLMGRSYKFESSPGTRLTSSQQ